MNKIPITPISFLGLAFLFVLAPAVSSGATPGTVAETSPPKFSDGDLRFDSFRLSNPLGSGGAVSPEQRVSQLIQEHETYVLTEDGKVWILGEGRLGKSEPVLNNAKEIVWDKALRAVHRDGSVWDLANGARVANSVDELPSTCQSPCQWPVRTLGGKPIPPAVTRLMAKSAKYELKDKCSVVLTKDGDLWIWYPAHADNTRSQPSLLAQGVSDYGWNTDAWLGLVALKKNGELVRWEDIYGSQNDRIGDLRTVATNVAWFSYFHIGKTDGSLWRWVTPQSGPKAGTNGKTLVKLPDELKDITATVGNTEAYGITASGDLWRWGAHHQSDTDRPSMILQPKRLLSGAAEVVQLRKQIFVYKKDGSLWMHQGDDRFVHLANDIAYFDGRFLLQTDGSLWHLSQYPEPQLSPLADLVVELHRRKTPDQASEFIHLIKSDGSLWAWGYNRNGELGLGRQDYYETPIPVMTHVRVAAAGSWNGYAIKTDGTLWAWGDNRAGQLGAGQETGPTRIGYAFSEVSATGNSVFAIKQDGSLWAWGGNQFGQLGNGDTTDQRTPVSIGDNFKTVTAGDAYDVLAIRNDDSLWAWGGMEETPFMAAPPQRVGAGFQQVFPGCGFTLGLKENRGLWAWGENLSGQLGDGTQKKRSNPVHVLDDVVQADAGSAKSVAVKADGTLWTWGSDYDNKGNKPRRIGRDFKQAVANDSTIYALNGKGEIWRYGGEREWRAQKEWKRLGAEGGYVRLIKGRGNCGSGDTDQPMFALKGNGSLWGWGPASLGQLGQGVMRLQQAARVQFPADKK